MQMSLRGLFRRNTAPRDLALQTYWSLLARYLRPHRGKVALIVLLLASTIVLQLINPQIVRRFIDAAEAGEPMRFLFWLALLFLGAALLRYLVTLVLTYISEDVGWRTTNQLRADLTAHCLQLDLPFHHRYTPGTLIERVDGDVGLLARFFSQFVVQLLGNFLLLFGILIVLTGEDWRLGVGFFLFLVGALLILFRLRNFATPYLQAERAASADLYGFIEERLGGTEDIRANGAVAYTVQRLLDYLRIFWRRGMDARPRNAVFGSIIVIWFQLGTVLALALGAVLFLRDLVTIGTVYLLYAYLRMASGPLLNMTREIQQLQEATASIARIGELFAETRTIDDGPVTKLPIGPLFVQFDQVCFGYGRRANDKSVEGEAGEQAVAENGGGNHEVEGDKALLFQDFSLTLPAGRTLGLLGRTGSGKTTLTSLLLRFYDPHTGAIRLGDVDLRDLTLSTLRHHVAIVTQDVQIFNATLRDNLTFFVPTVRDQSIEDALAKVGLETWLSVQPDGLDTILQSGGGSLSAGEAQLLAFARVLLKNPSVVILDEASSRLDPATERRLDRAIQTLWYNRTAIVIAHRLATVQKVDDILILDAGQIQEYGSRVELAADPTSRFAQLLRTGQINHEDIS